MAKGSSLPALIGFATAATRSPALGTSTRPTGHQTCHAIRKRLVSPMHLLNKATLQALLVFMPMLRGGSHDALEARGSKPHGLSIAHHARNRQKQSGATRTRGLASRQSRLGQTLVSTPQRCLATSPPPTLARSPKAPWSHMGSRKLMHLTSPNYKDRQRCSVALSVQFDPLVWIIYVSAKRRERA